MISETTQYLTFRLDEEVFAVDVAKVREILDFIPSTKVPGVPEFMRGVINVRGSVVPVVDLRLKFGKSMTERTVDTCIVIMEMAFDEDIAVVGALADSVQEVFELEPAQIEPPPRMGAGWRTEYVKGIGKRNNELILILDIDKVFSSEESTLLLSSNAPAVLSQEGASSAPAM